MNSEELNKRAQLIVHREIIYCFSFVFTLRIHLDISERPLVLGASISIDRIYERAQLERYEHSDSNENYK